MWLCFEIQELNLKDFQNKTIVANEELAILKLWKHLLKDGSGSERATKIPGVRHLVLYQIFYSN